MIRAYINATTKAVTRAVIPGSGLNQNSFSSEANALFARMVVKPDDTRKILVNETISSLKTAGIWAKLDAFWMYAAHSEDESLLNWVKDDHNCVPVNFPLHRIDKGWRGDAKSAYIRTGYVPSVNSDKFTLNSASMGIGFFTQNSTEGFCMGSSNVDSTNGYTVIIQKFGGQSAFSVNGNNTWAYKNQAVFGRFLIANRTASNVIKGYVDGIEVASGSQNSVGLSTGEIILMGAKVSGTVYAQDNREVAFAYIGSGLTPEEIVDFVTITDNYLSAIENPVLEVLGDFASGSTVTHTDNLLRKLVGDGWIKCSSGTYTISQLTQAVMFLHNSTTFPANNLGLTAYSFWYSSDSKIHALPPNVLSSATLQNNQWMRIRREKWIVYWEYSNDGTNWTEITKANIAGTLFAGLMFLAANTFLKDVTVYGLEPYGYTVQSSGDMRFYIPYGFTASDKVILYTHGVGEDEDAPLTDTLKKPTIEAFLEHGWGVISCLADGNNWGNQQSLDDYYSLLAWARTIHNFTDVSIFAQSMGGCAGLQLFMTDPQFDRFIGIYPVCNLAWCWTYGDVSWDSQIKSAYGFSDDADYGTATDGHDPFLLSGSLLNGRKMLLVASESDTVVTKDNNTDAFYAKYYGNADITVITASGNHGDTSHFNPMRDISFFQD